MNDSLIAVSLAYAPTAEEQWYQEIQVPKNSTIMTALQMSGWLQKDEALAQWCEQHQNTLLVDKREWRVGIFSQKQPLSYVLCSNDRIEIYRTLSVDPMNKRRKRASSI